MALKRIMRAFKMNEISAVDTPAQKHAKAVIMKRADDVVEKDLWTVSRFGETLNAIAYMISSTTDERAREGDNSKVPESLKEWLKAGVAIYRSMSEEEISELLASSLMHKKESGQMAMTEQETKDFEALKKRADDLEEAVEKAAKMSEKHRQYYSSLSAEEKQDFLAMSESERDKKISANPDKQEADPPKLKKALEELSEKDAIIKRFVEREQTAAFEKRAVEIGLPASKGATIRKAYEGDDAAQAELEKMIKGLVGQVDAGALLKEFGTSHGSDVTTAKAEIEKKAADYQASQVSLGKRCSIEQAFTAVYTSRENADLKKRYDAEVSKSKRAVA